MSFDTEFIQIYSLTSSYGLYLLIGLLNSFWLKHEYLVDI